MGENYTAPVRGYGRLRWRLDGFVALSAAYDGSTGVLITRPLVLNDSGTERRRPGGEVRLELNAETSVSGAIVVQLLTAQHEPVPGFAPASLPVVGNSVAATALFNATFNRSSPTGRSFSCAVENGPAAMPAPTDVATSADISAALATVGAQGLRIRLQVRDAKLYSISLVTRQVQ